MKYIVWKDAEAAPDVGVIFHDGIRHVDMAAALHMAHNLIQGAGFCYMSINGTLVCSGTSLSLGVRSRDAKDSDVLNNM